SSSGPEDREPPEHGEGPRPTEGEDPRGHGPFRGHDGLAPARAHPTLVPAPCAVVSRLRIRKPTTAPQPRRFLNPPSPPHQPSAGTLPSDAEEGAMRWSCRPIGCATMPGWS